MKHKRKPSNFVVLNRWITFWVCCVLLFFMACFPAGAAEESRQDTAIIMVARTLERLGEKALAKRFLEDYFNNGRVKIKDLGGEGVNAETGPTGLLGGGKNVMTLDDDILSQTADQKRIWEKNPYAHSLNIVGWAVTVYHEYVHMDQNNPQNIPTYEDPAWQKTDKAIATWCERLKNEFDNLKSEPASSMKGDKLQELKDIFRHLKSQSALFKEAVERNILEGKLSRGMTWEYPVLVTKIESIIQDIDTEIGRNKTVSQLVNSTSGWKQESVTTHEIKVKDDSEWYWNHKFTLSDGSGSGGLSWKDNWNSGSVSFNASWTGLSPVLQPGGKVTVVFNLSTSASQTGGYRNMGGWLYLKVKGMKIGDDVKHGGSTDNLPPPTVEKREFVVPQGKDGDTMEILIFYHNNAGSGTIVYKYVYSSPTSSPGASGTSTNSGIGASGAGAIKVEINGVNIDFDVPPVIEKGRTLLPLRKIAETLGCTVDWKPPGSIFVQKDGTQINLEINKNVAYVNGKAKVLDVPPRVIENRTLLPLRFLSEALGLKINWDDQTQEVIISGV